MPLIPMRAQGNGLSVFRPVSCHDVLGQGDRRHRGAMTPGQRARMQRDAKSDLAARALIRAEDMNRAEQIARLRAARERARGTLSDEPTRFPPASPSPFAYLTGGNAGDTSADAAKMRGANGRKHTRFAIA